MKFVYEYNDGMLGLIAVMVESNIIHIEVGSIDLGDDDASFAIVQLPAREWHKMIALVEKEIG